MGQPEAWKMIRRLAALGSITLGQAADTYYLATLHGAEHTPARAGSADRPGKRLE